MKMRSGFISNSSSSSFVVAFPKNPTTKEELKEMLFPNMNYFRFPYCDEVAPIYDAVNIIWEKIQNKTPNNIDSIQRALRYGDYDGAPNENSFVDYDAYKHADLEASKKRAEKFMNDNPNSVIYCFELSDNCYPLEGALEHGNTFRNVPHISISNH